MKRLVQLLLSVLSFKYYVDPQGEIKLKIHTGTSSYWDKSSNNNNIGALKSVLYSLMQCPLIEVPLYSSVYFFAEVRLLQMWSSD